MGKPNDTQVESALRIFREHMRQHGNTATESVQRRLIFSIYSALTGDGDIAQEYKGASQVNVINDPNEAPKDQLSNASDPTGSYSTSDPEKGGSTARTAVTGAPGAEADQQRAAAAAATARDPKGAETPEQSRQQLPEGDTPAHPDGRPSATTNIQSWPPSDADLPKYTMRELTPLTKDELIDYAIPAGIENPHEMGHQELAQSINAAAFGTPEEGDDTDDAEEEETEVEGESYTREELEGMTVPDLKAIANEADIEIASNAKKADIVNAIMGEDGGE